MVIVDLLIGLLLSSDESREPILGSRRCTRTEGDFHPFVNNPHRRQP
jgi:hypothetical protein